MAQKKQTVLDRIMKERRISSAKLAADLDLSFSAIEKYRRGTENNPVLETAMKIAGYLGITDAVEIQKLFESAK